MTIKFKIGSYNIEQMINGDKSIMYIDDGWFSQSIIFYNNEDVEGNGKWACDFPEKLPKYIKEFLNTVIIK